MKKLFMKRNQKHLWDNIVIIIFCLDLLLPVIRLRRSHYAWYVEKNYVKAPRFHRAISILLPFSTTYVCEMSFSAMIIIKVKKTRKVEKSWEQFLSQFQVCAP